MNQVKMAGASGRRRSVSLEISVRLVWLCSVQLNEFLRPGLRVCWQKEGGGQQHFAQEKCNRAIGFTQNGQRHLAL